MAKKKEKYIVGIGAANVDIYGKSSIKIREHFDHPSTIQTTAGGVTRNILENVSKLGIKSVLLTVVGDDAHGKVVIDSCNKAHIDTKHILTVKDARTGIFVQAQDKNNDMYIAMCDMSITKYIDIKYIIANNRIIQKASAIVLDPSLDLETIDYIFNTYDNIPIFIDPISDLYAKKIKPYLTKLYCIKPNKTELQVLSDIKIKNNDDLIKAYKKVNDYTDHLFVSVGKDGCIYENDNGEIKQRRFKPVRKMVNASGAGDAMMAAIIYGYIKELKIEKTVDYGLAAGIAAITNEHTINPNLSTKLLKDIIKENKNELH